APKVAWPDGYAGNGGVKFVPPGSLLRGAPSGDQSVSATVSGLPSVPAARIATTGRQKSLTYFAPQQQMPASAMLTLTGANSRAFSATELCSCRAITWTIWLYSRGGVPRPGLPS